MRAIQLGGALLASVALLTGCGSSNSKLSYSAFSNAADKICASTTSEIAGLRLNNIQQANSAAAGTLSKALADGDGAISKFKGLSGPSALQSDMSSYVGNYEQQAAVIRTMISAAKSGDQSAYVKGAQSLGALEAQRNAQGAQLGAPDCAK
jgi:hypothetical protein